MQAFKNEALRKIFRLDKEEAIGRWGNETRKLAWVAQ
jgi:hypothetical protein